MRPNHLHCYVTNRVPNIRILHESDKRHVDKKIKIQLLDAKVVLNCLLDVFWQRHIGKTNLCSESSPVKENCFEQCWWMRRWVSDGNKMALCGDVSHLDPTNGSLGGGGVWGWGGVRMCVCVCVGGVTMCVRPSGGYKGANCNQTKRTTHWG